MDVRARLRFLRIGPRKVRLLTNLLRGRSVASAEAQLRVTPKAAAKPLLKLLQSAVANARHNYQLDPDRLVIQSFLTDEGPKLRRWTPRAFGRAAPILKRMSHVTIVLRERMAQSEQRIVGGKSRRSATSSLPKPPASRQPPAARR